MSDVDVITTTNTSMMSSENLFMSDVDVVTAGNTSTMSSVNLSMNSSASGVTTSVSSISFPCETNHVTPPIDHIKSIQLSIDKQIDSLKLWTNTLLMDFYVGETFHKSCNVNEYVGNKKDYTCITFCNKMYPVEGGFKGAGWKS